VTADGYRFLSEQAPNVESRVQGSSSDNPPSAGILTPLDGEGILNTSPALYGLTGQASDDVAIESVVWSVAAVDGTATILKTFWTNQAGNDWFFATDFFQSAPEGDYVVSLTATDVSGNVSVDSVLVHVVDSEQADVYVGVQAHTDGVVETQIGNLGPFAANDLVVDVVYNLMGVIHWIEDVELPDQCELLPPPSSSQCPNSHCDSVVRCTINELGSGEILRLRQKPCTDPSSVNVVVDGVLVPPFNPQDPNTSNNSDSASVTSCGGGHSS
jgi:hypothetical protein